MVIPFGKSGGVFVSESGGASEQKLLRPSDTICPALRKLIHVAKKGPEHKGVPGPVRAWLYRLAAETDFRANELQSPAGRRLRLEAMPSLTDEPAASSAKATGTDGVLQHSLQRAAYIRGDSVRLG